MNKVPLSILPYFNSATLFHFGDVIHIVCRSADWYTFTPIARYLLNMAASLIRMEDAKTETREYSRERFDLLGPLLEQALDDTPTAAFEAWKLWVGDGREFGVVHLELEDGKRGDLLLGDDPNDVWHFWPWFDPKKYEADPIYSARGAEGSDV